MSDNRDFKGVWIPKDIWLSKDMNLFEKCLLVEIDSLDCGPKHCFKSNETFAEFFQVSVPTVSRAVKSLAQKGFVSVALIKTPHGSERTIKSLIKMISVTDQNDQTPTDQNDSQGNTSSSSKKKESNTATKHKHGEFSNVLLTDDELEKLKTSFPLDWQQRIKTMDEGIELKGYKYKSHYLAILKWAEKDRTNSTPLFNTDPNDAARFHDPLKDIIKLRGNK